MFVRLITLFLEKIGFRRRILYLTDLNWEQIRWGRIFRVSPLIKLGYKLYPVSLSELMAAGDSEVAQEISEQVTSENYRELALNGFNIWELAKTGILGVLEVTTLEQVGDHEIGVIKSFYHQSILCLTGGGVLLLKIKPWAVLVCQGCPHTVRPVVEMARRRGVVTVATEGTFARDYFFCDSLTGMIVNRHTAGRVAGDWLPARSLSATERVRVRERVRTLGMVKRKEHITGGLDDEDDIYRHFNLNPKRKLALFIGQVFTDASILLDSPVFPSPIDLISRVHGFFAKHPDWNLIIRLHPKEVHGRTWAVSPEDPHGNGLLFNCLTLRKMKERGIEEIENIRIVWDTDIKTSTLLDMADLGVTCNSQAGFEMALLYKRVIVAGDAFYSRKNFTLDVSHETALESLLDYSLRNPEMNDVSRFAVDRFAHYLFEDCLFRRDLDGQWDRLFRVFDGHWGRDIRSRILMYECQRLNARSKYDRFMFTLGEV